jgi:acyl carrier protein
MAEGKAPSARSVSDQYLSLLSDNFGRKALLACSAALSLSDETARQAIAIATGVDDTNDLLLSDIKSLGCVQEQWDGSWYIVETVRLELVRRLHELPPLIEQRLHQLLALEAERRYQAADPNTQLGRFMARSARLEVAFQRSFVRDSQQQAGHDFRSIWDAAEGQEKHVVAIAVGHMAEELAQRFPQFATEVVFFQGVATARARTDEEQPLEIPLEILNGPADAVTYAPGGSAALDAEELREDATSQLPYNMVPAEFVVPRALPGTFHGKVNWRALSAADRSAATEAAPRTPIEEVLAAIFCQVLVLPAVGIHDNFFDLGGHSLLATQVASRVRGGVGIELDIRSLFEAPTVAGLAQRITARYRLEGAPAVAVPPLRPLPRGAHPRLPLSFAQQRLWFLDQLQPGSPLYTVPVAFRIEGRLDVAALAGALAEIVRRHEVLRTRFVEVGGEPVQVISPRLPEPMLPLIDLGALPAATHARESRRLAQEAVRQPFDLARGPLVRFALARLAAEEHTFFLAMHHIVSDAWSMGILLRELAALYSGFRTTTLARLPPLPVQYVDYAIWQREWLHGEVLERDIDYWRGQLDGSAAMLDLPADRPRPAVQSYRGDFTSWRLPRALGERLDAAAREMVATPFIVLMAAFQALLYRSTQQTEINVGTPIAGRTRVETEDLIGFFVNTLVLRTSLAGNPTFAALVARVRGVALGAYAHQDVPFERLVEALEPERSLSHTPLFQVMFALHNEPLVFTLAGLRMTPIGTHGGTAKFDLLLALGNEGEGLAGGFEYNADLFDGATVARLREELENLLTGALDASAQQLSQLPLLSPAARIQLQAHPPEEFVPPRTPLEKLVAKIWTEELQVERVGMHDNFWELGGYSLLAIRALARVSKELDLDLPLETLFTSPTIAGLTAAIAKRLQKDESDVESNLVFVASSVVSSPA